MVEISTCSDVYNKLSIPGIVLSPEEFKYYHKNLPESLFKEIVKVCKISEESESFLSDLDNNDIDCLLSNNVRSYSISSKLSSLLDRLNVSYNLEQDVAYFYMITSLWNNKDKYSLGGRRDYFNNPEDIVLYSLEGIRNQFKLDSNIKSSKVFIKISDILQIHGYNRLTFCYGINDKYNNTLVIPEIYLGTLVKPSIVEYPGDYYLFRKKS